jgi:anti-sigma factor RsiW
MEEGKTNHYRSCREVFAELSAWLDAELPDDACREIEEHIAGCPPCVEFVESLRKTVEICRRYEPGVLPEAISSRAREQLFAAWQRTLKVRGRTAT